jgi:hypothetical protein
VIETWEWMLLFCFPSGLKHGSAAQTFDEFDPALGTMKYMDQKQPYIFSGLLCLNSPEETFSAQVGDIVKTISYKEATDQLAQMIHVDVGSSHA